MMSETICIFGVEGLAKIEMQGARKLIGSVLGRQGSRLGDQYVPHEILLRVTPGNLNCYNVHDLGKKAGADRPM